MNIQRLKDDSLFGRLYKLPDPETQTIMTYGDYGVTYTPESILSTTPWLYSSYLTSIWIYLFLIGGIIIRGLGLVARLMQVFEKYVRLDEKPIQSIGYVLIWLVTITFLFFAPLAV